ncbi:MAG TPA: hypothetical protein VJO54_05195 [Burkholderiales bacterium]|nr:hypothetical protein [Burkholderiales bacterium]
MRILAAAALLAAASAALAQSGSARLSTRPGLEIGGQIASYDYKEPGLAELEGSRLGFVGAWTSTIGAGVFARIDARASYGSLDYRGSGSMSGVPDLILETRAVAGFDWDLGGATLSPYAGLGYRYLYDDLNGYSSTGAAGYRRYSNYLYAPIGLTLRFALSADWVLAPTAELDVFLRGKQKSMLSDANSAFSNVTNTQDHGTGYRLYLMFERDRLAVGPYLHYWHIQDSDVQPIGGGQLGLEPENFTREYGLELRYRF